MHTCMFIFTRTGALASRLHPCFWTETLCKKCDLYIHACMHLMWMLQGSYICIHEACSEEYCDAMQSGEHAYQTAQHHIPEASLPFIWFVCRHMFALWWSMPLVGTSWCTSTLMCSRSHELCSTLLVLCWAYSTCTRVRLSTGESAKWQR